MVPYSNFYKTKIFVTTGKSELRKSYIQCSYLTFGLMTKLDGWIKLRVRRIKKDLFSQTWVFEGTTKIKTIPNRKFSFSLDSQ